MVVLSDNAWETILRFMAEMIQNESVEGLYLVCIGNGQQEFRLEIVVIYSGNLNSIKSIKELFDYVLEVNQRYSTRYSHKKRVKDEELFEYMRFFVFSIKDYGEAYGTNENKRHLASGHIIYDKNGLLLKQKENYTIIETETLSTARTVDFSNLETAPSLDYKKLKK